MRIHRLFATLAVIYILCILILQRMISQEMMNHLWNPLSLLHIPLYGILMFLLSVALSPRLFDPAATSFYPSSLLLPGGIAFLTGILDELNQRFMPGRHASVTDLFLDFMGIVLAGLAIYFWQRRKGRIKL